MASKKKKTEAEKQEPEATEATPVVAEEPAPESEKKNRNREEFFESNLRVTLTREEIEDRADRAANIIEERDGLEEEMKAYQKAKKADIEKLDAEHRQLSNEVRTKATYRDVECKRTFDYNEGKVFEVRLDTGEILKKRLMTERELQMGLFEDPEKKTPSSGAPTNELEDEFSGDDQE